MSHLSRFQDVLLTFSLVFGVDGPFKSLAPDRAADMSLFNTIEFWLAPLIFDCFLCLRYNRPAERMGLVQPYQQLARSKAKIPYTPEKDTYIKCQKLGWDQIEALPISEKIVSDGALL